MALPTPAGAFAVLNDLGDPALELSRPVGVAVAYEDDEVHVSVDDLDAWATGATLSEALDELKASIVELYRDLAESTPEELGPLPARWLALLRKLVREVPLGG
jgi:predicted RecB family endonuclease